mmetsp:Transcript_17026/g.26298  ORF Transcript_17026/g.26298 Transcript_17026/m.26298 type:complete len:363 (-) Transcript_17026:21-1109(-)|eukprot:CAMPEP_0170485186 /NCGR_PEP_ID=MMETSP0208-20121228/4496_1 /TAXON_ID=197538 /ORGANISM="Strombidium inclinatum, Strain S3" /LENGTH=362 /DNA_ID=CAMNT_0010758755 /DNA_START=278 /DNA_END=1366 /DNA_ORIENTATION=+
MIEIAKAAYLDEILFGKANSKERFEIESAIELSFNFASPEEHVAHLNQFLATRMFMVGHTISAADIVAFLHVADYFKELMDFQKIEQCHAFRWIDHIQHLPGLDNLIQSLGLFVSFPDENNSEPSKAQLKKLAKIQAAKEKKEAKKGGDKKPAEEKKEAPKEAQAAQEKPKKQKQQQQKPQQQKKPAVDPNLKDIQKVDIRVGRIIDVCKNPNSDKLYNERIDIGNGVIREIASGLQQHIPLEKMKDAMVVVIVNLKARKLADFMSQGMVLCASPADKSTIEFLNPPEGSVPGDEVFFEGYERKPLEMLPAKKNPWDNVAPKLNTDENGMGCFLDEASGKNIPFATAKGVCTAATVKKGIIS